MTFEPKDPSDVLDYTFNWVDELGTDTITSSLFTVPTGITKTTESNTTTTTTVWLSGGTDAVFYSIVNRIVTAAGRTFERTAVVPVRNR